MLKTGLDTDMSTDSLLKQSTEESSKPSRKSVDQCLTGNDSGSMQPPVVAEWNGHKHEEVPGDTITSWVYLVQYVAGAEAWECTETDAMAFYSMAPSYKNWHQAHGRIDRLSTSFLDLHYYRLISRSELDYVADRRLKEKKSFNEAAFMEFLGIDGF